MKTLTITDALGWAPATDGPDPGFPVMAAVLNLTWAMHTRAAISITTASVDRPSRAVLLQGGVELVVMLLEPKGASFTSTAVHVPPPQKATDGIFKLMVEVARAVGAEAVKVSFTVGALRVN